MALGLWYTLIATSILLSVALKTFTQYILLIILLKSKKSYSGRDLRRSYLAIVYTQFILGISSPIDFAVAGGGALIGFLQGLALVFFSIGFLNSITTFLKRSNWL